MCIRRSYHYQYQPTGVFRNSALGVYLVFRWNKVDISIGLVPVVGISGNEWEIFPNKRPWGAPTDGRYAYENFFPNKRPWGAQTDGRY